ncbi:MAG TPA: cytochrome c3 family protein [Candidatus Limnocylindria bacterium]|nr:cytochrome c3 family protein [Candidatus Limnocylindria bacterium]
MKRALALVIVAATLAAATHALSQSFSVQLGKNQGPKQPIFYSHELHAGKLGMDCLYCHTGAEKSPIANIPAVGTCMGCHKLAATDRPEVQKLAGYYERGEQVPWVEVYRLPDHVKFNHKRHVKAGVACQTCHGPVEKMPVVYQYSSLKMGWCVSCHRQNIDHPEYPAPMDCLVCHH